MNDPELEDEGTVVANSIDMIGLDAERDLVTIQLLAWLAVEAAIRVSEDASINMALNFGRDKKEPTRVRCNPPR